MVNNVVNNIDETPLFKSGYEFKVEVYDFDSPEMLAEIARSQKEGADILSRKEIDRDTYHNRVVGEKVGY